MFNSISIIQNVNLVDYEILLEDWSQVRSPSRAARRLKQGHRQRIRYYHPPSRKIMVLPSGTMVCHPVVYRELEKAIKLGRAPEWLKENGLPGWK